MFVVIYLASDTRLGVVCIGQRGSEGNTTVGRVEETSVQSVRLYIAQYAGQRGTAQHTGQERFIRHNILGKETTYSTTYWTKKIFIQLNIPDKNALYGTIYRKSALYSTINGEKTRYRAQYTGQKS